MEQFCSRCGQKRPREADYSMRSVLVAAFERVTQFDGRLLRTLRVLLLSPGRLARDHFDGRRSRYVPAFELFVFANLVAWLLVPLLHIHGFSLPMVQKLALLRAHWPSAFGWREALSGQAHEVFAQRLEAASATVNKLTVLCLVPLFALATRLVLLGRPYRGVHHLIFSVHFYCIHLTAVLVAWGLFFIPSYRYLVAHPELAFATPLTSLWRSGWFQQLSVAPLLLPYLYLALKTAFRLDGPSAAWRSVLLTLTACSLLRAFFDVGGLLMMIVV